MDTIRVVIAGRSHFVSDVLAAVARAHRDLQVVAEVTEPLTLMMAVRTLRAHAVVLDADDRTLSGLSSHLFGEYPELTILGVGAHEAYIEQLCPLRTVRRGISVEEILEALRQSVRTPCE